MRKYGNDGKASYVLNDTLKCMCENATHHDLERHFGGKWVDDWNSIYIHYDNVNFLNFSKYGIGHCKAPGTVAVNNIQNDHYQHHKLFNNITCEEILVDNNEYKTSLEQISKGKYYFDDCACDYCNYVKNVEENNYETCYCCKSKIYTRDVFTCNDCGSKLCVNCNYISYSCDYYCYECRKFGDDKNAHVYHKEYEYNREGDWDNANRNY